MAYSEAKLFSFYKKEKNKKGFSAWNKQSKTVYVFQRLKFNDITAD
jgi:hypothetical protein